MAVIGKIREKAGWAIGLIAVGLGLFIVGADFIGPGSRIFGSNAMNVGEIAGQEVSGKEYDAEVERFKANMVNQNITPNEQQLQQVREQAWQQMIFKYAYQQEFDKLGLGFTAEERDDMIIGDNIYPGLKQEQTFQNPTTKQFDKALLNRYIDYVESDSANPQAVMQWQSFLAQMPQTRLREKYSNLLKNSLYVTQAEAKREYEAQSSKVNARYVFIPYYSIPDSTVKVSDEELTNYLSAHRTLYKGDETRSLKYVTFPILPSAKDSMSMKEQLIDLSKQLASASNDSAFAIANSEVSVPGNGTYQAIGQLPQEIQNNITTYIAGSINGPFQDGNEYYIFKYGGTINDTLPSMRASHILFRVDTTATPEVKADAKSRAEDVLKQIQGGASFEAMAQQYGSDGTASQGGDLGWFSKNGQMVKKFENALFGFNGSGVMPSLVETEFGFHIIKVTQPKTYQKYKISVIRKPIMPSKETEDAIYRKASLFASQAKDVESFDAAVKKDPSLSAYTADRIAPQASSINTLSQAREIVRWAYNDDQKVGDVSKELFQLNEPSQYVVAVLTGKSTKNVPTIEGYRADLTSKVRNQKKAEQIIKKLGTVSGTLDAMAQKYGPQAQVQTADAMTINAGLAGTGPEPTVVGQAFALKAGQKSKAITGESGVFIIEVISTTPAPQIADYAQYKNQLQQSKTFTMGYLSDQAIQDKSNIEDLRYKFY